MKIALRKRRGLKFSSLSIDIYLGKDQKRKHEPLPFKLINDPKTAAERKENKVNLEKAEMGFELFSVFWAVPANSKRILLSLKRR